MTLNKVMVIGNVGRDPEMRFTPGGQAVTTFSVASSRRWRGQDNEMKEHTEWFNVVAWGRLAETCNQLITKGRKVYIEGRLETRSWDGQDGQKHYRTEVIANEMRLLDSRQQAAGGGTRPEPDAPADEFEPDDIPF